MSEFNTKKTRAHIGISQSICLTCVISLSAPAMAEATSGAETADRNEIVVTAQRREQKLQDAAAAISALGSEAIDERGIDNLSDLQGQVPGFIFSEIAGSPLIGIRGISLDVVTGDADAAIATHVDGVYQARATQTSTNMNDIERIEVLRGPQGTLYGRNATGGAINFITRKPTPYFEGQIKAGVGNYDLSTLSGYLSGPVIDDRLLARVSGSFSDWDGNLREIVTGERFNGNRSLSGRLALRWLPSEVVTIDLAGFTQSDKSEGPLYELFGVPNATTPLGTYSLEPFTTRRDEDDPEIYSHKRTSGLTLTSNIETDNFVLRSITGYTNHKLRQHYDGDASSVFLVRVDREDVSDSFSQEISLSSSVGSSIEWVAGTYFSYENYDFTLDVPFGPFAFPATGLLQNKVEKTTTIAVFADATLPIGDRLRLIVGARGALENRKVNQTQATVVDGIGTLDSCRNLRGKRNFEFFTPRGGLQYDLTDNQMAYALLSRGYKSGGAAISTCGDTFDPEYVTSIEVGYKSELLDGHMSLNGAVFYYDYTDLQVAQIDGSAVLVNNAPAATIYGAEIETIASPGAGLRFDAALSLLHARYDEFFDTDALGGPIDEDLSGNRLVRAPDWTLSLGAEKTLDLGGDSELKFRGEIFHSDDIYFRAFNRPEDRQSAYTIANAYLIFTNHGSGLSGRLWVKNLTNQYYIATLASTSLQSTREGYHAPPRTYGVDLSLNF